MTRRKAHRAKTTKKKRAVKRAVKRTARKRNYEQENAARRLRRRAATLERKAAAAGPAQAVIYRESARQLRDAVKGTYKSATPQERQRSMAMSRAPTTRQARRERMGQMLLKNPAVSRRFYGVTKQVWARPENMVEGRYDFKLMTQSITRAFGAEDVLEVFEALASQDIDVMPDSQEQEISYKKVVIIGARNVAALL